MPVQIYVDSIKIIIKCVWCKKNCLVSSLLRWWLWVLKTGLFILVKCMIYHIVELSGQWLRGSDLSLDPQCPCKNQGVVAQACNPRTEWAVSSRLRESCLKKQGGGWLRTPDDLRPPHMRMPTHEHMHKNIFHGHWVHSTATLRPPTCSHHHLGLCNHPKPKPCTTN